MDFLLINILFFSVFYLIALLKDDFGIIDVAWGISFLALYVTGLLTANLPLTGRVLILGLAIFIWSLRLSGYILYRNLKLKQEDPRYAEMRKSWGKRIKLNENIKELMGKSIVMTGFRDMDIENHLLGFGIQVSSSVSSKTGIVIAKDPSSNSGKVKKARELGVTVIGVEAFKKKYL